MYAAPATELLVEGFALGFGRHLWLGILRNIVWLHSFVCPQLEKRQAAASEKEMAMHQELARREAELTKREEQAKDAEIRIQVRT